MVRDELSVVVAETVEVSLGTKLLVWLGLKEELCIRLSLLLVDKLSEDDIDSVILPVDEGLSV